jgi:integrase
MPSPIGSELVKAVLRGTKRRNGRVHKEARPLLRDDLFAALDALGGGPKDIRDKALLLLGFAGGFKRSELVGINQADIEAVRQGIIVYLRRSKTDQEGEGRKIGIPHGRTRWCPVAALDQWLLRSGIVDGAVFRPIDRHGRISAERLSGEAVSLVVKECAVKAGLDPARHSGHSLRAGLATSAAQAGVPTWKIRQTTGHTTDVMLARYIRDGQLFVENAAGALL